MILITGGAGFIGSNLVAGLEAAGLTDLVICDRFGEGDKWRNVGKRELCDIVHPDHLMSYLDEHKAEVEMIYHLGGVSSTTETDADRVIVNNFNLSRQIWRWCAQNGVRLVYASSGSTYGDGAAGFADDQTPEFLARLIPMNPYGWSKNLFDRRIARICAAGGEAVPPQWVGLKFFNVYGPNEYHKHDQMSVACKLYPQVEMGAAVRLFKSAHPQYKDGEQKRDFIYVADCVDVMLWLYKNKNVSGLFNLGTGQARSFNDLASAMFKAAGKPPKFNYLDMPQELVSRYQNFTEAKMDKLRAAGYTKPFTDLETGITAYVRDYLSKSDRYR